MLVIILRHAILSENRLLLFIIIHSLQLTLNVQCILIIQSSKVIGKAINI